MTLRHMIIFRTVAEKGCNTTKAAETLHMTQPAVSLAIKELEQYYDVHLFDRFGRRLQITDAGRHFLQYAIHISDLFKDMEEVLHDEGLGGTLRIGAGITIGSQFLPGYIQAFSSICPGIEAKVYVEQSEKLEQRILANELDCALVEGIPSDSKIISEAYMQDYLVVAASSKAGFKQGQIISKEEFKKQRFLLREPGSGTRDIFDQVMATADIHISPCWEAESTSALINAVIAGLGIAILPHRMVAPSLKKGLITTVSVDGLSFERNYYIIYHKDKFLTPGAKKFISLCKELKDSHAFEYQ